MQRGNSNTMVLLALGVCASCALFQGVTAGKLPSNCEMFEDDKCTKTMNWVMDWHTVDADGCIHASGYYEGKKDEHTHNMKFICKDDAVHMLEYPKDTGNCGAEPEPAKDVTAEWAKIVGGECWKQPVEEGKKGDYYIKCGQEAPKAVVGGVGNCGGAGAAAPAPAAPAPASAPGEGVAAGSPRRGGQLATVAPLVSLLAILVAAAQR